MDKSHSVIYKFTLALLFIILLIFGLIYSRNFLYPILTAVLIAYLLYPLANFLERHGFPRILANIISIIFGLIIVSGGIYFLYSQISIFVEDLPTLRRQAIDNIIQLERFIEEKTGISTVAQQQWIEGTINDLFESGTEVFGTAFTTTTGTIARVSLMPVFVFFMLYYRDKFKNFILQIVPDEKHEKTERILDDVSYVTEKYMSGVFVVVLILCVLNSIGMIIVGIKYAILFGIISALFNFIPYFGTLIGGIIPLAYTLFLSPYPEKVVGIIIYFSIIQFTENNILTPNITGGNVQLNPFITILSIILGGMLWGIPGMFLIVPYLAMFKISCGYFEPLKPYAYLLGIEGAEEHSLTREKIVRFFKIRKRSEHPDQ